MGDFWAESIRLASPATERFLCLLGQGKSRLEWTSDNYGHLWQCYIAGWTEETKYFLSALSYL